MEAAAPHGEAPACDSLLRDSVLTPVLLLPARNKLGNGEGEMCLKSAAHTVFGSDLKGGRDGD